jgi:hypothetical protein
MPSGEEYRTKAAEFMARAQAETDQSIIFELQTLARSYLRLAEHADGKDPRRIRVEPADDAMPPPEQIPRPEDSSEA